MEAMLARWCFRQLAESLADRGLAVLRFDYQFEGDSAGAIHGTEGPQNWLGCTRAAVAAMRGLGVPWIGVVGMRLGAICAAATASEESIDALVLWDPCGDGRAFLREQVLLFDAAIGVVAASDSVVETPGFGYDAATASQFSKLKMADVSGPLTSKTMVLTRPGREADRRVVAHLVPPDVEWAEASGQDGMFVVGGSAGGRPSRRIA